MRDKSEVYEAMWERRQRVWNEIAQKERRYADEAIFRTLENRKGDDHGQERNSQKG